MRRKIINIYFFCIILISIYLNFNSFIMSNQKWINTLISVVYLVSTYVFIVLSRKNKTSLIFIFIWGIFTLICSIAIFIVNLNNKLIMDFIIPFAIVFITPLSGLVTFFKNSRFLMTSGLCIIISIS